MEIKGCVNRYVCEECKGSLVTVNLVDGVTPFMIRCYVKMGCVGSMLSSFYRVPQDLPVQYEWYRPDGAELELLDNEMRQHVNMGGLMLRKRRT